MTTTVAPYTAFHEQLSEIIQSGVNDKSSPTEIYWNRLQKWCRASALNMVLVLYLCFTSPIKFYLGFIHRMITVFRHVPKTRQAIDKNLRFWQIIIGLFIMPYLTIYMFTRPIYLLLDVFKFIKSGYDLKESKLFQQTLRLCVFCESWIQLIYLLAHNDGNYEIAEFDKNFYHRIFAKCGIYHPVSYTFHEQKWSGEFPEKCDLLIKPVEGAQGYNQSFWRYQAGKYENEEMKCSKSKQEVIEYVEQQSKDSKVGYNSFMIQNHLKMHEKWSKQIRSMYHILLRIGTLKVSDNEIRPFLAELIVSASWTSHKRLGIIYCDVRNGRPLAFVNHWFDEKAVPLNAADFVVDEDLYTEAVRLAVAAHKAMPDDIVPDHSWDILVSDQGVCFLEGSYVGARGTHYFYHSLQVLNLHLQAYSIDIARIFGVVCVVVVALISLLCCFY